MGQGWSHGSLMEASKQGRVRNESEPPSSSGGGRSVCGRIIEDEELAATEIPTPLYESGILKDKLQQKTGAATSTFTPRSTGSTKFANNYQHFVDYSLFPDKFSTPPTTKASTSTPLPTPPQQPVAASSFLLRNRAASESADAALTLLDDDVAVAPELRPRSRSYAGRLPFFDFSMIPDKDPNFKEDKPMGQWRARDEAVNKPLLDLQVTPPVVVSQDPAALVAAALTIAASDEKQKVQSSPATEQDSHRPRFTLFDYSMIPDKDPRTSVGKNNLSPGHNDK